MLSSCAIAFKEWASVCGALGDGRQSVILRKGGIEEGPAGFRPVHQTFWLYPTKFHQSPEQVQPADAAYLQRARDQQPPAGDVEICCLVNAEQVWQVVDESRLPLLMPFTILSEETLQQRFNYREPGLFVLAVRVFELPRPVVIRETAAYAGCKSWVDLEEPLSTLGASPVVEDEAFRETLTDLTTRLR